MPAANCGIIDAENKQEANDPPPDALVTRIR
jgi:hypothetical protein